MRLLAAIVFAAATAAYADPVAVVPFRWTPGQIEVEVSVNGKPPVWFIVDTGAEYSIVSADVAKRLDLKTTRRGIREFASGVTLRTGKIELRDQEVMVFALDNFKHQRRAIVGLIGYDFFARYVVTIDYDAHTLTFHEPRTFRAPLTAKVIPITFSDRTAVVPVRIAIPGSAPLDANVIIDTGASLALALRHPFAQAHGLIELAAKHPITRSGSVAQTSVTWLSLPSDRVTLGPFAFISPVLRMYARPSGAGGYTQTDGLLGNEILRRFTVTIDYSRKRLYLAPNAQFKEPLPQR